MVSFMHPGYFWLIIPLFFFLFFIISRNFVRLKQKDQYLEHEMIKKRTRLRLIVFVLRMLMLVCIVIALTTPYDLLKQKTTGSPKAKVILDKTSSMDVFDIDSEKLIEKLKEQVSLSVNYLSTNDSSPIGDSILSLLEQDSNILLISDGQNNRGIDLDDIAIHALNLNATISAIELNTDKKDVGVQVLGPSKTVSGVENVFRVKISKLNIDNYKLIVTVDNKPVIDTISDKEIHEFVEYLSEGQHEIVAKVSAENDFFQENNVFFKVVNVIEKPKVAFVTKKPSELEQIYSVLYNLDVMNTVPTNLEQYYAVVINDMPFRDINNVDNLIDYVIDENGLFAVGGMNSFDRGGYKGSYFEQVLPVYVGSGEKKEGNVNIVLLIDISGSTASVFKNGSQNIIVDIEKGLAIGILQSNIGKQNNVGVIAFNSQAYIVQDIAPLKSNFNTIIDKIKRLRNFGGTGLSKGLAGALEMLKDKGGSRNIIMITDGKGTIRNDYPLTIEIAKIIGNAGIKIFTVGVGADSNAAVLKEIANIGNGQFIQPNELQKIGLLFGESEEEKEIGEKFELVVMNDDHFITKDLTLDATLHAYNSVVPKSTAQLLVVADNGQPAVTSWQYGLGRVVTLNVFDINNLGELLNKRNSKLLSRIGNYVIGDPERKKPYYVIINDGRINEQNEVILKAEKVPETDLEFFKYEDVYKASFMPSLIGFDKKLEKKFATNYAKEYEKFGMSDELKNVVQISGGKIFKEGDIEQIVEFLRSVSEREKIDYKFYIWPFLILAIVLFLVEIIVRKLYEYYT